MSAAEKSPKDVDKKFERATEVLHSHGTDWHSRGPNQSISLSVKERMAAAKAKDKEILLPFVNRLKEKMASSKVGFKVISNVGLLLMLIPNRRSAL